MHDILEKQQIESVPTDVLVDSNSATDTTELSKTEVITFGGVDYTSDRALGFYPFEETDGRTSLDYAVIPPARMDDFAEGTTTISGVIQEEVDDMGAVEDVVIKRAIEIIPTERGRTISLESLGKSDPYWETMPDTYRLMESLGFVTTEAEGIVAIPTPETVKNAAKELGVEIAFFPNTDVLSSEDYLATFAAGKYPVSLKHHYKHDITDDHLTGTVLGGEPLKNALKEAAIRYLGADTETVNDATVSIDALTNILRKIVSKSVDDDVPYRAERGRATFHKIAALLDISPEVADEIIATAQKNGRAFEMNVTELR